MTDSQDPSVPVTEVAQLVAYLEAGCKPRADWRIGTEHEKFGFRKADLRPLSYEGDQGIGAVLHALERFGWIPVREAGKTIALRLGGQSITLEPGGQLELSGDKLETLHQTCDEVHIHLEQVRTVAEELDIGFFGLGFQPKWRLDEIPIMPKGRYQIMRAYMPKRGKLGLEMMLRTCTVQTNLDFHSESDMVRKFRVALALQPIATALYANSPFTEGKPNGYLSYRSHIWMDTDADRCGTLPFVFEDGMGFERYAEHALDVPMYFVYRDGAYVDASGQSFRDFLDGRLGALPGERPRLGDWEDHLTTLFPEVRLKRFLEMRGADGGPWRRLCALPAFWVGLLYDDAALDAAWDMVKTWSAEEREAMRNEAPRLALGTPFRNRSLADLAREAVDIAAAGLQRRARFDRYGESEAHFLDALHVILDSGRTPAEEHLIAYEKRWDGSVDPLFTEKAY